MNRKYMVGVIFIGALFLWFLTVSAIAGATFLSDDRDVFAPYASMMPGQPLDAAHCDRSFVIDTMIYCYLEPTDPVFDLVVATVKDGITQDTLFRSTSLPSGDLILRWGYPDDIQRRQDMFTLSWETGICAVVENKTNRHFRHHLSVLLISLHNNALTPSAPPADPASAPGPPPACGY